MFFLFGSLTADQNLQKECNKPKIGPQQAHPPPIWLGPGRNSPSMKASCPLELPPKLLRGARMRPSNRGTILDMFFLFGSLTACQNLKKRLKTLKIGPQQPQPPLTPIGSGRDLHIPPLTPDEPPLNGGRYVSNYRLQL